MRTRFRRHLIGFAGLAVTSLAAPGLAQTPAAPKFEMTKVADNVYSFSFVIFPPILHRNMVVVTNDGVIVTDPISPLAAGLMMDEIKKLTDKPVKLVIYSHNHWDHISGARIFKDQGAKVLQHELAARSTRPHPNVVPADEIFAGEKHVVTLGDEIVELYYFGPTHGSGMVVMRLPKSRILHTVDVVAPNRVVFANMPDWHPHSWIPALRKMEQLDFDRVIPGHGPASAPKSAVTGQREYLEDLGKAVAEGTKKAGSPYAIDKITEYVKEDLRPKYGTWGQFDSEWLKQNVDRITLDQRLGW